MDRPQTVDPISPELKFVLNNYLTCYYESGNAGSNTLDFAAYICFHYYVKIAL